MVAVEASDVVTAAVLAFVGVRLVDGLRHTLKASGRSLLRAIVAEIGWRHVWPVPVVLAGVVAAASLLMLVPGLDWGWWSAFGGEGNPVFGSSEATAGTFVEWAIPAIFVVLLIPTLPLFAYAEERMFRRGAQNWSRPHRVVKVIQFGLVHALIGIPVGTALALSIAGAYFMRVYLREFSTTASGEGATLESTRAHTAYNACVLAIVAVVVVADAVL